MRRSSFTRYRHTGKTQGVPQQKDRARPDIPHDIALLMSQQAKWRKLDGTNPMPEIIQGIEFRGGIKQLQTAA